MRFAIVFPNSSIIIVLKVTSVSPWIGQISLLFKSEFSIFWFNAHHSSTTHVSCFICPSFVYEALHKTGFRNRRLTLEVVKEQRSKPKNIEGNYFLKYNSYEGEIQKGQGVQWAKVSITSHALKLIHASLIQVTFRWHDSWLVWLFHTFTQTREGTCNLRSLIAILNL